MVDDELNVLPISKGKHVKPLPLKSGDEAKTEEEMELEELKESLADTEPVASLVKGTKTIDQAKAVLTFIEAISEKSLRSTVALTAGRGRGKSAALGIAMASAVAYGYSNIFVTSPSPENLKTLFQFVFKTFDALGYEEHLDYDIVQSTNPDFNKAIVRVNIFRQHRQTIQVRQRYLFLFCQGTYEGYSTFNPKMHMCLVKLNCSSLMKLLLFLFLLYASCLVLISSLWHLLSMVMKAQVDHYHSN